MGMLISQLLVQSSVYCVSEVMLHLYKLLKVSFFILILYWGIVDEQCCVSFRCTAKWFSYTYTCISSFSNCFPLQVITKYWAELPVLYSRSLLVIYFIYLCAQSLSHVQLFETPWTVACQASLFMELFQARVPEWVVISYSRVSS